jgi:hypothetical protein
VQEATSNHEKWVFCGGAGISTAVDAAMAILRELARYSEFNLAMGKGHYDNILTLYEIKTEREKQELPLLAELSKFYKYDCFDVRDKVYAALGIAHDVENHIIPDYSRSVPDVYTDVVKFSLSNKDPHQRLDFLGHVLL